MNSKTTYSLEDLARSLQTTRIKAQKALDKSEIGVLSRVFDVDEAGKPKFVVWECRLPSGDGGERSQEMLRLPWNSFYQSENVVAEISVEMDCEIRRKTPTTMNSETRYTLRPGINHQQKFKLALGLDKDYIAEATVDGIPLEVFLDENSSQLKENVIPVYKRIWPWLMTFGLLVIIAITAVLWFRYSGQI